MGRFVVVEATVDGGIVLAGVVLDVLLSQGTLPDSVVVLTVPSSGAFGLHIFKS